MKLPTGGEAAVHGNLQLQLLGFSAISLHGQGKAKEGGKKEAAPKKDAAPKKEKEAAPKKEAAPNKDAAPKKDAKQDKKKALLL